MSLSIAAPLLLLMLLADPLDQGMKALEAQQYPAAVAAFERAAAADPEDYSAHFHLGLARSLAGQTVEAVPAYRKTLALKPGLYEAQLNLGILLLGLHQAADAAPLLKEAAAKKPAQYRPNYYLGEALLASGDATGAEASLRAALQIDPKSTEAAASLGRALLRQGKKAEAAEQLRAASDDEGLLELAALHEKNGDFAAAIAIYKPIAAARPDDPPINERLGVLLMNSGQAGEAIPLLEKAVQRSPTTANRFALATAYLRDKQLEKANALLAEATADSPDNIELILAQAGLQRDQKNFNAAAQLFFRVTQLQPDNKPAWSGLATMLFSLENYPQSVAAFDKLESLGDATPGLYYLRALALDKQHNYKPAQANYQKFLSVSENKFPDEEFKARQRLKVIEKELARR